MVSVVKQFGSAESTCSGVRSHDNFSIIFFFLFVKTVFFNLYCFLGELFMKYLFHISRAKN